MIQLRQELSSNLSLDLEAVYGTRAATARSSRGTLNAEAFGPTAPAVNQAAGQVNPSISAMPPRAPAGNPL